MKLFGHTDIDGRACLAILTRKYPEATIINYNYFYDPEKTINLVEPDEEVIFADITPTMENLELLMNITKNITIIDHHESSLRDLQKAGLVFPGIQTADGIGACALVWDWCWKESPKPAIPYGIRCIAEYDGWDRTPENKMFYFGLQTIATFPTHRNWDKILSDDHNMCQAILNVGRNVLAYLVPWYKRVIRSYSIKGSIEAVVSEGIQYPRYNALFINQGAVDGSIFDDVEERYDVYIRGVFGKNQRWLISLTTNSGDVDVSLIARMFGGGGHKKAAGCAIDDLSDLFTPSQNDQDQERYKKLPIQDSVHP